jgi:hypothetical protein
MLIFKSFLYVELGQIVLKGIIKFSSSAVSFSHWYVSMIALMVVSLLTVSRIVLTLLSGASTCWHMSGLRDRRSIS